ncbi:uncharacterized protein HMPREF1541_03530 [Cyphellophora europaea CBS 101466]|uniref:DNA mismatch repair protein MSH5 n=1 Tax=Cyphellophora europaea (strain CBS 101466) TaxID=1220924 RepID=W2S0W2_CYPE1|nr:uncharacterized protein HMPREF1541_03530 [Cyphellophora europaea CBS 101466]ETN41594.1 hypothetical protein HMPREF1541_03530 [Cyphellophora europaea CBS 101466]
MALDVRDRGTIGCAYYIAREERLFCLEDVPNGGVEVSEKLKLDVHPTVILVSTRHEALSETLSRPQAVHEGSLLDYNSQTRPTPYKVDLRPNPEFNYEGALDKLSRLGTLHADTSVQFLAPGDDDTFEGTPGTPDFGLSSRQGALIQVSAWLDLDSKVSIGCLGAVIGYLRRRRSSEYLQHDPDAQFAHRISCLEMFTLKNTMFVNADTLSSLQIIMPETHPNAFNQGPGTTGSKESLSLLGLFVALAKTPQGKARLRRLFLRPSMDIDEINSRLDFVSIFARADNQTISIKLSKSLSKIKNLRNVMTMLHKGIEAGNKQGGFKSGVWSTLLEFCYYTISIVEDLREVIGGEQLTLCARAAEVLDRFQLQRIGRMVHDVVDLELSQEQRRTVAKRGIDDALDQIKDVYDGMDDLLSRVARDVAQTMPPELDCQINVIFFPQLGFHITVPLDEVTGYPVWTGDGTWERMFTTKNVVYFKEAKMRQMDAELGDLWAGICDAEIEIVHDLAQRVLQDEKLLVTASDLCGELDCLLALAHGAVQYNLTRPKIVEDSRIEVRGGRHLLQEMVVSSYVTNDTSLGGDRSPNVLILTGPNYSGKSVYQNQVAIIVYMAQIGSFVPADYCTLGLTDKIFTRITTTETVSKAHSAFMIDLQQIALALNTCTRRSLLIIDEFGKGTDSADGAGLAAGVLQHLLELGHNGPMVLFATHLHEIFELGLFIEEPGLAHVHMKVYIDERTNGKSRLGEMHEQVTYMYELRAGRSMLSYGAQCAAMNGVPRQAVERAVCLAESIAKGEDLVVSCSGVGAAEMEDLELAEQVCRRFLGEDLGEAVELVDEQEGWRGILEAVLDMDADETSMDSGTGIWQDGKDGSGDTSLMKEMGSS